MWTGGESTREVSGQSCVASRCSPHRPHIPCPQVNLHLASAILSSEGPVQGIFGARVHSGSGWRSRGVTGALGEGLSLAWNCISLAHVQGHSYPVRTCAVTVTPRKKERETCWDRLCWAAFGLGSCRYQGTLGSASPPVASSPLLSCPWGSQLFPWLRCFPDTSRPWLLPQVPKGSPVGHGSVCSDHWRLGPAPNRLLIQTVNFLMPIALSRGPSSTLSEWAQLGASGSGATLGLGLFLLQTVTGISVREGVILFLLELKVFGADLPGTAGRVGGGGWAEERLPECHHMPPPLPTGQCLGSLLFSNHSA